MNVKPSSSYWKISSLRNQSTFECKRESSFWAISPKAWIGAARFLYSRTPISLYYWMNIVKTANRGILKQKTKIAVKIQWMSSSFRRKRNSVSDLGLPSEKHTCFPFHRYRLMCWIFTNCRGQSANLNRTCLILPFVLSVNQDSIYIYGLTVLTTSGVVTK